MKIYLGNAFSLQMIPEGGIIEVNKLTIEQVLESLIDEDILEGIIGHEDTANLVNSILNLNLTHSRKSIVLNDDDILVVAQVTGGRLPVGCTELPEGCKLEFYSVNFVDY
jgi:hypothetical protein